MMRQIIIPVLLVLASGVGFYFFIDPMYESVLEKQEQITRYNEALEKSQELVSLREKLVSQYNSFSSEQLEKMRAMLPSENDKIELIIGLNTIGDTYDIQPENIQFDDEAGGGSSQGSASDYRTMGMQFNASAPYTDIFGFLQALQQSERLIDITEIQIDASGGKEEPEFQIAIQTYAASI